ncbi:MAG: ATP-binding protein [Candidatus Dependentiae bacterium]|nr:ATP-binding protein [Candidatus Dependentiae bacterium]
MAERKKKYISVGIDNFEQLITGDYYFVDKSPLIKEILDSRAKVTLLPRPRRFGKTLNMSMLHCFFEKRPEQNSRRPLFHGLKIEEHPDCMEHQGKYPVIWLTFKDVKMETWLPCYEKICKVIGTEFTRHFGVIKPILSGVELQRVEAIIAGTASQALYEDALLDLSGYLVRAYGAKVIILIDEYDAPIHAGYLKGYYQEIIGFMRGFLGAGLKGNDALNLGVMTGILRVAKESIFSGINNLEVRTLLQDAYSDKFGFLEDEVKAILTYFGLETQIAEVRYWYDGYQSGPRKVYNPWSIINLVKNRGEIQPYWVNTSDNTLIKDMLRRSTPEMKEDLEVIIKGGAVTKPIQENIIMPDIEKSDEALWNFLVFSGYLTFEHYRREVRTWFAELRVPNEEVLIAYETSFKNWFDEGAGVRNYILMLEGLIAGDPIQFKKTFERFSRETLSYFDVQGDTPENFYHALVLGMLASLMQTHQVRSNRESGYGRYDVMVIPNDRSRPAAVIEFKAVEQDEKETIESAAQDALNQLEHRQYEIELRAMGLTKILKLGIAFKGKQSLVLVGK